MSKLRISKGTSLLVGIALCAILTPLIWLGVKGLEGEPPTLLWERPIYAIGQSFTLTGAAFDQKSGLKRIWIAILQQGREVVLLDQRFPGVPLWGERVREQPVTLEINVRKLGLEDGEALLRTVAWDLSYRRWWSGNRAYEEHSIIIDTRPPDVEVLTRNHNLNQGGAGLAIYRTSEPVAASGVHVNDRLFPGFRGHLEGSHVFLAFFAVPYDEGPDAQVYVTATDLAGNTSPRTGLSHHINEKTFKNDTLSISDAFLKRKVPPLEEAQDKGDPSLSMLEKFLAINKDLRQANHKAIQDVCKKSDAKLHWNGPFLRLPASARKASFGDYRTYQYEGRHIDNQVHLGIDLASTARSPVPASNSGRVAFANDLGIYGKSVLIDHGFGLFSMYGHLSRIEVTTGQVVSKGEIIGFTGSTGLAGGDHLHFSMVIHHTFVNPVEWWDPVWVKNNITKKLDEMGSPG